MPAYHIGAVLVHLGDSRPEDKIHSLMCAAGLKRRFSMTAFRSWVRRKARAILAVMISPRQRRAMLMADRTGDARTITAAVVAVMVANPDISLTDIEETFRAGAAQAYLIAAPLTAAGFEIALGAMKFRHRLVALGRTIEQNRAMLGRR